MSAPSRPSLRRRLALYVSMLRYGHAHSHDFAREHYEFFVRMRRDVERLLGPLEGLRVLDVGCGKSMWLTLLLRSVGARVTGIDTEWVEPGQGLAKYGRILRANGLERAARTLVWDALYARPYYRTLARICPFPLRFDDVDARKMSVTELDFDDATFDLVVSHEVFEHLSDVEGALRELRRILEPDGLTYIYVHNYTSLSGGHHIAWKYPDLEPSRVVPPWDHLRENVAPDIPSWINRWREHQYRAAFEREFEVLDWIHTEREGAALLEPDIRRELSTYSEEELLTKGFIAVARPIRSTSREGAEAPRAAGRAAPRDRSGVD